MESAEAQPFQPARWRRRSELPEYAIVNASSLSKATMPRYRHSDVDFRCAVSVRCLPTRLAVLHTSPFPFRQTTYLSHLVGEISKSRYRSCTFRTLHPVSSSVTCSCLWVVRSSTRTLCAENVCRKLGRTSQPQESPCTVHYKLALQNASGTVLS